MPGYTALTRDRVLEVLFADLDAAAAAYAQAAAEYHGEFARPSRMSEVA